MKAIVSDEQIVEAVADIRSTAGVCNYALLSERLGISRAGVHHRVVKLKRDGILADTGIAGSLRVVGVRDRQPPMVMLRDAPGPTAREKRPVKEPEPAPVPENESRLEREMRLAREAESA